MKSRTSLQLTRSMLLLALGYGLAPAPRAAAQVAMQTSEDIYRSAYFSGRGNTGIAAADDEDAVFYNPAGLAQGKGIYKRTVLASPMVEVSQSTRDLATQVMQNGKSSNTDAEIGEVESQIGKPNHVGVSDFTGIILRRAALGVFTSSHADFLAYKDPNAGGLEAVEASADETTGMTFSLADDLMNGHLLVGGTFKYMQRGRGYASASAADIDTLESKFADKSSFIGTGYGDGVDLGMMLLGGGRMNPALGLTVDDVGDSHVTPSTATSLNLGLRQTVNAGVSIEPGTRFSHFKLLADYRDLLGAADKDPYKRSHFGAELEVFDMIGVTGGLNQGYPTAGLYADLYFMRIDLGAYTEEMGDRVGVRPDTRYFFRLRAGF